MSLGQDRLTFAAVLIASAIAVFGYMRLGSVFTVAGDGIAGHDGVAGENDGGGEPPGDRPGEMEGADHGVGQVDLDPPHPHGE